MFGLNEKSSTEWIKYSDIKCIYSTVEYYKQNAKSFNLYAKYERDPG